MKPAVVLTIVLAAGAGSLHAQSTQQPPESRQVPPPPTEKVPTAPADEALNIPTGERWLGTVRIPERVLADGKPLPAGRYRVRLTGQAAESAPLGQLAKLERWIEFVQGNAVKGRAMAPVVPSRAVEQVADSRPPAQGRFRIERLKQDDYLRLWYNVGGDQILIYLPIVPRAPAVERGNR